MLEQFLTTLGPRFAVPAAFLLVGAWDLHVLLGLHDSKRRNRIEFLEVCPDVEKMDGLRLEITIRHLVGTFFPVSVIRAINRMPFPTKTLFALSEVWSLVRFDSQTHALDCKSPAYGNHASRRWLRALAIDGYVAFSIQR